MPNVNAPFGLLPVRHLQGNAWNGGVRTYSIAAADTNAYWVGDRVTTIGNAGADTNGVAAVTLAAAGTAARGVVVAIGLQPFGPFINADNLRSMNRPSGAQTSVYYVAVVDDPTLIYEVQEAGAGSVLTAASVNRNVNLNNGIRTGTKFFSPAYLDNNTVNTTSTLDLKILGAVQRADNTPFTASQRWLVMLNNHEFKAGTTSP